MDRFLVMKVNSLPDQADWTPSTMYMVKNETNPLLLDIYLTDKNALTIRRTITEQEVQVLINASLNDFNQAEIVDDITQRDALVLNKNTPVWVLDATDDLTVASGAALYLYNVTLETFTKIAEAENMDVTLDWVNVQNKPSSSVADIDDAVTKKHSHDNKAVLDVLTLDADNNLLVDGVPLAIAWETTEW